MRRRRLLGILLGRYGNKEKGKQKWSAEMFLVKEAEKNGLGFREGMYSMAVYLKDVHTMVRLSAQFVWCSDQI